MSSLQTNRLEQFGSLAFYARQVVEGFITGLHKSPFHGFSVEFAEHRLYNTGESIRNIDWKLFGRTDRLYVKRFEEETNLRCQILLDSSSSMFYPVMNQPDIEHPNKMIFSVYVAAALIYLFRKQRDAAGISLFSDQIELHTQAKSSNVHHAYLYQELEKLLKPLDPSAQKKTSMAATIHELAERIHKRSLVVILSDMLESGDHSDDLFSALQHLKHNKHEVILFHVTDKSKEVDFQFDNRPSRFVDVETGERIRLYPAQVKEQYQKAVEKYFREIKLRCAQYHIDLVEADINQGFEQVLLPYLVKRNRLY